MKASNVDDLISCRKCGCVFDTDYCKKIETEDSWDPIYYVCPLCGNEESDEL